MLQEIDSSIIDVDVFATNGVMHVDIGLDSLVPINMLGDGVRRLTTYILALAFVQNGVLLVDEIDSGLHYSALCDMWRLILSSCVKANGPQLFATTHSDECVKALNAVLQEKYHDQDIARLIRIEAGKDQHYASNFTTDIMDKALEMKLEVR